MRILHLSKFYPPDPGGLEHVVECLAEGAAERGHEVRVICATGSSWVRDPGKRVTEPPRKGVGIVRLPTYRVVWSQPIAPGYVAASRWPADVVYVHRPHPLADFASRIGLERPTIVFHHSDVQRQRVARWLYGPLARSVARRARAVVIATKSHLQAARDLGSKGRERARVIPYGVDESRFALRHHPTRPEGFPPESKGPVGIFVGRLVAYKGLDVLLRAVAGTDLPVVIVGDGPVRAALEQQIAQLRLGDQVVLAGPVDSRELPGYYQAADYFVLPSTTPAEMFGIAQLEAMACMRPVISTALPTGVREVNQPDVTGLEVPPGDVDALRTAMERLARETDLRARLGAAGRKRVEERFTIRKMMDEHLALCEEVAKG